MAKKIQVSTVRQMADVQVINVSSRLVCLAVKAQITLESLISNATSPATKWNDEMHGWDEVTDEAGNKVMNIGTIDGAKVSESVMPFLNELVDALKGDEE